VEQSRGRRALVTGASTGIGREIALTLARDGYDVALTSRDTGRLADVIADPDFTGVTAVPIELELTSLHGIERAIDTAAEALGGLDVLVNNAGAALIKPALEVTWEDWDTVIDANLKGTYFLTCRFAQQCLDSGRGGAVVNIASTHGFLGFSGRTVYGISKGGIIQMTRMLAIEWAERNIRVNTVAPATVMTESRKKSLGDPEVRQLMLERIPSRRFPEPSDIGAAVRYLAGPEAASITGQTTVVDGGLSVA
jgi:NAD(P)-dependent dehydrogenase (short-subunit alcohol dehydrogenase family)